MGDWLHHITLSAKAKTGFGGGLVVCYLVAALAVVLAVVFLCVAAFVFVESRYGGVWAGLILAGIFVAIAFVVLVAAALARRRAMEKARLELAARSQAAWLSPKMLTLGLEVGRAIGWQRIVTLAAVGVVAAGLGKEWSGARKKEPETGESG
jgi:hypothetical protein